MKPRIIRIQRAYDVSPRDRGYRVLVDRMWPRGVTKLSLSLDQWAKELAPSAKLRRWFNHDADRWLEFRKRYYRELDSQEEAVAGLLADAKRRPLLLIYGARDTEHNNAVALRDYLIRHRSRS